MLTFVSWKWRAPTGYHSTFGPQTVHVLRTMIARHYAKPHRFICITDDATGLDGIETFPLWQDWRTVPSPHGGNNPACYTRIKAFSPDAREWFGERFVSMDLDAVIVSDITPLFDRDEDFVAWRDPLHIGQHNGSLWTLTAGSRRQVFETFDPQTSPKAALAAGMKGSDQAWISHCLPGELQWTQADGVYNYRFDLKGGRLPENARIVFFTGSVKPWQAMHVGWVREHYRAPGFESRAGIHATRPSDVARIVGRVELTPLRPGDASLSPLRSGMR